MPRLSRKSRRAKVEWTAAHVRALLTGHDHFYVFGVDDDDRTPERKRECWNQLRYQLLPDFIAEHPGRRPWAWWAFDCTAGPRRMLVPPEEVGWRPLGEATWFGRPRLFEPLPGQAHPDGVFPLIEAMYETEYEYLRRHRLLEPEEREALNQRGQ